MSVGEDGPSKCSQKTALTLFFTAELLAFIFSLVALISPTWQHVNLENGRTEHHHGLWLDCKRDFSHEYGRNREFYETLSRLDVQLHPFDHFFLPPLDCVYKFDYYIDTEDLYDHNHDENRLQDDANQHLFLGWKIAAVAAFGLAVLASGASLLLCICAFCHRTLICATTALVAVATVLSSVGLLVFYIWGNYQDNNIIKEDDGIYEQYFGWAFYAQAIGTILHFFASFLGCIATSVAFTKEKAKLVKIEVVDGDSASLLENGSSRPFKRSFSAIYKVDSAALRHWEKEYMNKIKNETFIKQRTGSMPNIKKGEKYQQRMNSLGPSRSASQTFLDISGSNRTLTTNTFESSPERCPIPLAPLVAPKSQLKPVLKQPTRANGRGSEDSDVTYEVLPCDTSFDERSRGLPSNHRRLREANLKENEVSSTINAYDKVYEPSKWDTQAESYEEPNSIRSRNSLSSFGDNLSASQAALRKALLYEESVKSFDLPLREPKSILINDVLEDRPRTAESHSMSTRGFRREDECMTSSEFLQLRNEKKRHEAKSSASGLRPEVLSKPPIPEKPILLSAGTQPQIDIRSFAVTRKETDFDELPSPSTSAGVHINTFDVGDFNRKSGQRTITNLNFCANNNENVEAFQRANSSEVTSLSSFSSPVKQPHLLNHQIFTQQPSAAASDLSTKTKKRNLIRVLPEEVDRSVGSSTLFENDAVSESPYTYLKEAELRLNLFMNGVAPLNGRDDKSSITSSSTKETNVTTV